MGSSTTTRNFGIRRFTNLVREGRLRSPESGTPIRLGTCVEHDATTPGYVKVAANSTGAGTRQLGILWYEHDSQSYVGAAAGTLIQDYDWAPNGRQVQVLRGRGAKVWLRNTEVNATEPGLNYPSDRAAVTMVAGLGSGGVAVGNLLGWNGSAWAVTGTAADAVFVVTAVDDEFAICDAELLV